MAFDKTNRGTLRKNDKKQEDWHPDYRGDLNFEGIEIWVDGIMKQWPDGTRYMSLKVRRKEPKADSPRSEPRSTSPKQPIAGKGAVGAAPIDDEIPF
jgi:hypothetical protein